METPADDLHPAIRDAVAEIRNVEDEQAKLRLRWAEAHLNLRRLVGSDSKVGKLLVLTPAAGRKRLISARKILAKAASKTSK